ncbi:hypothetical protein SCUP234_12523 [Seiridium cupressi]
MSGENVSKSPTRDKADTTNEESTIGESFFQDGQKQKRRIPRWLDHFNRRDLTILFKSSLAVWIMTILIFISKTLNAIGQAAFFGCIVLFIVPPSGVVFVHVLAGLTIVIGLLLGWAWGTITMKAALATRPQSDLNSQYTALQQAVQQGIVQASGQTPALQVAIYNGYMLDTRVTITYFCMMGLFIYLVSRIRIAAPKLTLVGIFAMVVADIYLAVAPLIPSFQGTIPKVLILPTVIAVGVGLVCNLCIFPKSTSSIVLDTTSNVLSPMSGFFHALNLHFQQPSRRFDVKALEQLKAEITVAYKSVDSSINFLPMDFSYGRWSPADISALHQPLRQILVTFGALVQLPLSQENSRVKETALLAVVEESLESTRSTFRVPIAHHQIAKALAMRDHARNPETEKLVLETFGILSSCAPPVLEAWPVAIDVILEALKHQSDRKVGRTQEPFEEAINNLQKLGETFKTTAAQKLLEPHSHLFDENGNIVRSEDPDRLAPLLAFLIGLLYQERIINLSDALLEMLQQIRRIEEGRQHKRVWVPKGLSKLFSWTFSKDEVPSTVDGTYDLRRTATAASVHQTRNQKGPKKSESSTTKTSNTDDAKTRLENMRTPHARQRSKASTILLGIVNWLSNDEGMHAARTLILTIALGVPAAITTSAGFYYREKGLWALIMSQMALVPYTSDFISSLLVRVIGTAAGGVFGLVCWYIGAGSGPGNAYGMAAIMAVAVVALMWWRLFAPPEQITAGIMMASTIYLVVSYSWIDTYNPTYGAPGVGYNVFWRRLLLVLIGFAASTIVMFLPRPPSGSRHYRELLSEQLRSVKERYALFASTWISPPSDLVEVCETEALLSQEILEASIQPITLLKFEFSSSTINTTALLKVCNICIDINSQITQLVLYTNRLTPHLQSRFMQVSGANDEKHIADLMAVLSLLQGSLETGRPLPAILPTPLLNRVSSKMSSDRGEKETDENEVEKLTARELLTAESGRHWASALGAYLALLTRTDELVLVLKKAVGEESGIDLASMASKFEEAITSADATLKSGIAENFFIAGRKENGFLILLEAWTGRINSTGLHARSLFSHLIRDGNISQAFRGASGDKLDYFQAYLAWERLRLIEDPYDGFSGPNYCKNLVLLIDYREFASAAMLANDSGPKQFDFFSTRHDRDKDSDQLESLLYVT